MATGTAPEAPNNQMGYMFCILDSLCAHSRILISSYGVLTAFVFCILLPPTQIFLFPYGANQCQKSFYIQKSATPNHILVKTVCHNFITVKTARCVYEYRPSAQVCTYQPHFTQNNWIRKSILSHHSAYRVPSCFSIRGEDLVQEVLQC
jgi:hypothetical protein